MKYTTPNIVISKCLGFDKCRYDGTISKSSVVEIMKNHVNFIQMCPEQSIGLPTPREAIRLAYIDSKKQLIKSKSGEDLTELMLEYCEKTSRELKQKPILEAIDGFILKSRSPSCGIKDVKLYSGPSKSPMLKKNEKGFFAKAIVDAFDYIILEDEGRLTNFRIREHFLASIFVHAQFREIKITQSLNDLINFHSQHKYLFMSFNQSRLKILGEIVANHDNQAIDTMLDNYEKELNKLLATYSNKGRQKNTLFHIFGFFSEDISSKEKEYFLEAIDCFNNKQIPLSSVLSILETWTLRFEKEYLLKQSIFHPFPKELLVMIDSQYQKR